MKNYPLYRNDGASGNDSVRLLADGIQVSNDTRKTGRNNNDLVIGPTGSGKTRYYCKPNLLQSEESMIITDTKGSLYEEFADILKTEGYEVFCLDFENVSRSCGYNPFDYIRREGNNRFSEKDVMTMASCIVPLTSYREPYWELAGQFLVGSLISFLLEFASPKDCNLKGMMRLFHETTIQGEGKGKSRYQYLMGEVKKKHPDSFAAKQFDMADCSAERTASCVRSITASHLRAFDFRGAENITGSGRSIDLRRFGRRKCALFVNVSDTDRSMDTLVNLFYTQAIHTLCYEADHCYRNHSLPVPVRFYFDDFAAGTMIPDFDKIISTIRSRNISVSILLQSLSQLDQLYGPSAAATIVNGCDTLLYLGGQDVDTSDTIARKLNRPLGDVLYMPLDRGWLFLRGEEPKLVKRYPLEKHPKYHMLSE